VPISGLADRSRGTRTAETLCLEQCLNLSRSSNSGKTSLFSKNAKNTHTVTIPSTRLDVFAEERNLDRIDMVKIDVEGAELLVLKGMRDCLLRFRPQVVLELEPTLLATAGNELKDFVDFFSEVNYELRLLDFPNYLAVPRERAEERGA
jgi:hypothetical protein